MKKRSAPIPREVIGIKTYKGLIEDGWNFGLSTDPPVIQEHTDGSWSIHYPEEGWIRTKPDEKWPMTTSFWPGATGDDSHNLAAAIDHALAITNRDPKLQRLRRVAA